MAIRLPLQKFTLSGSGTSSVATGQTQTFMLPQDTDNVVVKLRASVTGGGASAFLQTSDDGGTNWYDVGRTSVISNGVDWFTVTTTPTPTAIGSANASTLALKTVSGLPLMGQAAKVVISYSAAGTSNAVVVAEVIANNQSATA